MSGLPLHEHFVSRNGPAHSALKERNGVCRIRSETRQMKRLEKHSDAVCRTADFSSKEVELTQYGKAFNVDAWCKLFVVAC